MTLLAPAIPATTLMLAVLVATSAAAQNVTEWSTETRTVLSFHVNEAAAQRLLPTGWTVAPARPWPRSSTAPNNC